MKSISSQSSASGTISLLSLKKTAYPPIYRETMAALGYDPARMMHLSETRTTPRKKEKKDG